MMGIIFVVHGAVCFLLIAIILVQSGRGGGLVESFSGMESVFGTKTSAFMTKLTSVLAIMFMVSCLGLALMSVQQNRSLMSNVKPSLKVDKAVEKTQPVAVGKVPAVTAPAVSVPATAPKAESAVSVPVAAAGVPSESAKTEAPQSKTP